MDSNITSFSIFNHKIFDAILYESSSGKTPKINILIDL